jgi:hypothetical protein
MDKVTLAEHLLTPITGAPRASEIVGDLLEEAASSTAFWLSVMRVAFSYSWRWMIGVPAAMFSILLPAVPFVELLKRQMERQLSTELHSGGHLEHHPVIQASVFVLLAAVALWSIATLSLVRFGLRGGVTRTTGFLALLLSLSAYALCANMLSAGITALCVAVAVATVVAYRHRWAAALVTMTGSAHLGFFLLWSWSISLSVSHFGAASPVMPFVAMAGWIVVYIVEAIVFARSARWLKVPSTA